MEQKPRQTVPRPASTVLVLRPTGARFDVLMIRRHDQVAFMGGAHVFPGGSVDEADLRMQARGIGPVPPGHHAAAVRELAEEANITLPMEALTPFARWITPEIETKRFDVWFFVARAPAHQVAAHDSREAVDAVWMDPADALDRSRRDEIALPPPTWTTLRTLERFRTVDEAISWARARNIAPVQPVFTMNAGVGELMMPEEISSERRFRLKDGRWKPIEG